MEMIPPKPVITTHIENIPEEMKDKRQWIIWEWGDYDSKKMKYGKKPTSDFTKWSTDKSKWLTFDEAIKQIDDTKGLGFILLDSNLTCLDIDELQGGQSQELNNILTNINSFTETSIYKRGLHIIFNGNYGEGKRSDIKGCDHIEWWDGSSKRWIAITGDIDAYPNLSTPDDPNGDSSGPVPILYQNSY
jgi:primase-polymerase (primpol)-like protein